MKWKSTEELSLKLHLFHPAPSSLLVITTYPPRSLRVFRKQKEPQLFTRLISTCPVLERFAAAGIKQVEQFGMESFIHSSSQRIISRCAAFNLSWQLFKQATLLSALSELAPHIKEECFALTIVYCLETLSLTSKSHLV